MNIEGEKKKKKKKKTFIFLLLGGRKKEIERKRKGTGSSETFARAYQTTRCHIQEDSSVLSVSGNDVRSCAYVFFCISPVWGRKILEVCGGWRGWLIDVDNDFICLFFIGTAQLPE
jgi:hypothetical protein